ncbi:HAD hydrolase-like protein [Neisseria elongata]|jgi:hypothetical protein|uniref:HAD hydrolase-like protein n=1 Tax=Neisseria elongata TaxID=495 RepID=UPI000D30FAC5|nr:HAD hydrolase-like protein [Neisseria elongata]
MQPKLLIFDWDGTLADTTNPIIETVQQAFYECGLAKPPADRIRNLIGRSLMQMMQQLAPSAGMSKHEELVETYAAHYLNPNNRHMRLFPDVLPTLERLREAGYWLSVATGKGRSGLNQAIAQTGTGDFWLATACASECPSKPAPDMVWRLCDELGVMPSESIVIGDTAFDLEMAAHAGARGIGVATGAHSRETLQSAPNIGILSCFGELEGFLQRQGSIEAV